MGNDWLMSVSVVHAPVYPLILDLTGLFPTQPHVLIDKDTGMATVSLPLLVHEGVRLAHKLWDAGYNVSMRHLTGTHEALGGA